MNNKKYVMGLDFGTLSLRAVIADASNGEIAGESECSYPNGVIEKSLPEGAKLPLGSALQNPHDYIYAMKQVINGALNDSSLKKEDIYAVGVDFTSSTVLAVDENAIPMCSYGKFSNDPHAYAKLWKSCSAQKEAEKMNETAHRRKERWLSACGDYVSPEFIFPKLYETLNSSPELYKETYKFIEAGDFIVRLLTGEWTASEFSAGFKAMWSRENGYPDNSYLSEVDKRLCGVVEGKLCGKVMSSEAAVGRVGAEGAELFGLCEGTFVAASTIDAHSAMPAVGCSEEGRLMMILGTSACYIVNSSKRKNINGICGYIKSGLYGGLYTYEQSQRCFGDSFSRFIDNFVPEGYTAAAREAGISIYKYLGEKASELRIGESGLLVLDWFNGNKSVLSESRLSGMILGLTLKTTPEEVYRALIEGAAFGARMIVENYSSNGIEINEICASGGIALKDSLLMQILSDVLGREIRVSSSKQACALGGAVRAAVAGGLYKDIFEAERHMSASVSRIYSPIEENHIAYSKLYREYKELHDYFGRGGNDVMKRLYQTVLDF